MKLILYLIINTVAVMFAAYILKSGIVVSNITTALFVAIALGILNTILKPILIILTLPITILTLGLFTFVINALLVLLVAYIVPGFTVSNFLWAIAFSLIVSIVSSFLSHLT